MRRGSGVATYGALGHVPPSGFGNAAHSAAAASLTVKVLKITKEKHILHFSIFPSKFSKNFDFLRQFHKIFDFQRKTYITFFNFSEQIFEKFRFSQAIS